MAENRATYQEIAIVFLSVLAVNLWYAWYGGIDTHHCGIVLKPAMDVANGKIIFKETFTQYGAVFVWFDALLLKLFGFRLWTLLAMTSIWYALSGVCLWMLWRRFLPASVTGLVMAVWLWEHPVTAYVAYLPWASVQSMFFSLLAVLLTLHAIEHEKYWPVAAAGCLAGLNFWIKSPSGVATAVAIGLAVIAYRFGSKEKHGSRWVREIGVAAGTCIAVIGIIFAILLAQGAIGDWWQQSVVMGKMWAQSQSGSGGWQLLMFVYFPFLTPSWLLLVMITGGTVLSLAIRSRKKEGLLPADQAVLVISCAAGGLWLQEFPYTSSMSHAYWHGSLMIGIAVYSFVRAVEGKAHWTWRCKVPATVLCLLLIFSLELDLRWIGLSFMVRDRVAVLTYPEILAGVRVAKSEAIFYRRVTDILAQAHRDHPEAVLVLDGMDALYATFVPDFPMVHKMSVNWWFHPVIYPEFQGLVDNAIKDKKAVVLTIDPTKLLPDLVGKHHVMAPTQPPGYQTAMNVMIPLHKSFLQFYMPAGWSVPAERVDD